MHSHAEIFLSFCFKLKRPYCLSPKHTGVTQISGEKQCSVMKIQLWHLRGLYKGRLKLKVGRLDRHETTHRVTSYLILIHKLHLVTTYCPHEPVTVYENLQMT